ncbi:MAG: 4-(cytidine 5'-diphospho)-2-C-methyl-D-erythritol kinase [Candidatus Brocadiales bacterium]|nr:4-(cytidine 5'-diphospho)-2-C-methyl-D-erythritol kinase [Candidatus Brocadiales bacterium]
MVKEPRNLTVFAPAKINLFLEVLGKRPDGYHELETVMQEVDLKDTLEIEEIEEGIELTCTEPSIPKDESNLAWKAARLFQRKIGVEKGVRMHLVKRIPVGAGLGGGSSDAASVLKGLNTLWERGLDQRELLEMATQLGSDVPFFVQGGTALCKGRGDLVYPLRVKNNFVYVILYPEIIVTTSSVYKALKTGLTKSRKDVSFFLDALSSGDPESVGRLLFNRLEEVALGLYPVLRKIRTLLESYGPCGVLLSGSGSAVYGLCNTKREAEGIKENLKRQGMGKVYVVTNSVSFETA